MSIGTVESGDNPSATITGTSPNQTLNLVLEKGDTGDTGPTGPAGPSNSLSIGTVSKGDNPSATITGTSPNQTLNLVLPKGDPGYTPVKGTDYYTDTDIEELESSLSSDVHDEVSVQLGNLVSATPIAVSSVANMTDTTKIYVNTTDGYWYYYDGDSWEQGGVYLASASDKYMSSTSSNSLMNKTITDYIVQTEKTEEIAFTENYSIDTLGSQSLGTPISLVPTSNSSYQYAIVNCEEDDNFVLSGETSGSTQLLYAFLDSSDAVILRSGTSASVNGLIATAPKNAKKIVINVKKSSAKHCYKGISNSFKSNEYINLIKNGKIDISYNFQIRPVNTSGTIGNTITLDPGSTSGYLHAIIECKKDDKFIINVKGGNSPRAYAFLDADYKLLMLSKSNTTFTNYELVAPENSKWLVINTTTSGVNYKIEKKITSYEDIYNSIYGKTTPLKLQDGNITTNVDIGSTVSLTVNSSSTYKYDIIECEANDEFIVTGKGGNNPRLWAFLDSNNKLLSNSLANIQGSYKIKAPINSAKLIINFNTVASGGYTVDKVSLQNINENSVLKNATDIEELRAMYNYTDFKELYATGNDYVHSYVCGLKFAENIKNHITDFKKPGDLMVHVSTFDIIDNVLYATYYANTRTASEDPTKHTARFIYAQMNDLDNKTYIDLQDVGETFDGHTVQKIYDTIMLHKDNDTLYLMWTAQLDGVYYRLYRTYTISTGTLSSISYNNFKVENSTQLFSTSGMLDAFEANNINHKALAGDIGIMQKLTSRVENEETYYYTGCYVGDFNCIIKSTDLITWEFVAQPNFYNNSQWENATYVIGNYVYYYMRQHSNVNYGLLTKYNLTTKVWDEPVKVYDCQSRSDFFEYNDKLYLVFAPKNRNNLAIMQINQSELSYSVIIQNARVALCFYPFVVNHNGTLYMSFTYNRQNLYLVTFNIDELDNNEMDTIFNNLINS